MDDFELAFVGIESEMAEVSRYTATYEALTTYRNMITDSGMSRSIAVGIESISPGALNIPFNTFTEQASRTKLTVAVEAIDWKRGGLMVAAFVGILAIFIKLFEWLFGDGPRKSGGGGSSVDQIKVDEKLVERGEKLLEAVTETVNANDRNELNNDAKHFALSYQNLDTKDEIGKTAAKLVELLTKHIDSGSVDLKNAQMRMKYFESLVGHPKIKDMFKSNKKIIPLFLEWLGKPNGRLPNSLLLVYDMRDEVKVFTTAATKLENSIVEMALLTDKFINTVSNIEDVPRDKEEARKQREFLRDRLAQFNRDAYDMSERLFKELGFNKKFCDPMEDHASPDTIHSMPVKKAREAIDHKSAKREDTGGPADSFLSTVAEARVKSLSFHNEMPNGLYEDAVKGTAVAIAVMLNPNHRRNVKQSYLDISNNVLGSSGARKSIDRLKNTLKLLKSIENVASDNPIFTEPLFKRIDAVGRPGYTHYGYADNTQTGIIETKFPANLPEVVYMKSFAEGLKWFKVQFGELYGMKKRYLGAAIRFEREFEHFESAEKRAANL